MKSILRTGARGLLTVSVILVSTTTEAFFQSDTYPSGDVGSSGVVITSTYTENAYCAGRDDDDYVACSHQGEEFGYSVKLGKLTRNDEFDLIVGAPQYQDTDVANSNRYTYYNSGNTDKHGNSVNDYNRWQRTSYTGRVKVYQIDSGVITAYKQITKTIEDHDADTSYFSNDRDCRFGQHITLDNVFEASKPGILYISCLSFPLAIVASVDGVGSGLGNLEAQSVSYGNWGVNGVGYRSLVRTKSKILTPGWEEDQYNEYGRLRLYDVDSGSITSDSLYHFGMDDASTGRRFDSRSGHFLLGSLGRGSHENEVFLHCDPYLNNYRGICALADEDNTEFGSYDSTVGGFTVLGDQAGADFGHYGIVGKFNSDNFDDLIITQPGYSSSTLNDVGRIWIFQGTSGDQSIFSNSPSAKITGSYNLGRFGQSVSNVGDLNGDGLDDIAVGSPFADDHKGCITVFLATGDMTDPFTEHQVICGDASDDLFGFSISSGEDVNGDGVPDIAIGSPGYVTNGLARNGRVHVLEGRLFLSMSVAAAQPTTAQITDDIVATFTIACTSLRDCGSQQIQIDVTGLTTALASLNTGLLKPSGACPNAVTVDGNVVTILCSVTLTSGQSTNIELTYSSSILSGRSIKSLVKNFASTSEPVLVAVETSVSTSVLNEAQLSLGGSLILESIDKSTNTRSQIDYSPSDELRVYGIDVTNNQGQANDMQFIITHPAQMEFKRVQHNNPGSPVITCAISNPTTTFCFPSPSSTLGISQTFDMLQSAEIVFNAFSLVDSSIAVTVQAITSSNHNGILPSETSNQLTQRQNLPDPVVENAEFFSDLTIGCTGSDVATGSILSLIVSTLNSGTSTMLADDTTFLFSYDPRVFDQNSISVRQYVSSLDCIDILTTATNVNVECTLTNNIAPSTPVQLVVSGTMIGTSGNAQITNIQLNVIVDENSISSSVVNSDILAVCYQYQLNVNIALKNTTLSKTPFLINSNGAYYLPATSLATITRTVTIVNSGPSGMKTAQPLTISFAGDYETTTVSPTLQLTADSSSNSIFQVDIISQVTQDMIDNAPSETTMLLNFADPNAIVIGDLSQTLQLYNGVDIGIARNNIPLSLGTNGQDLILFRSNLSPVPATEYTITIEVDDALSITSQWMTDNNCDTPDVNPSLVELQTARKYTCTINEVSQALVVGDSSLAIAMRVESDTSYNGEFRDTVYVQASIAAVSPSQDTIDRSSRSKSVLWSMEPSNGLDMALGMSGNNRPLVESDYALSISLLKLSDNINFTAAGTSIETAFAVAIFDLVTDTAEDYTEFTKQCSEGIPSVTVDGNLGTITCTMINDVSGANGGLGFAYKLRVKSTVSALTSFSISSSYSPGTNEDIDLSNNFVTLNGQISSPKYDLALDATVDSKQVYSGSKSILEVVLYNLEISEAESVVLYVGNNNFNNMTFELSGDNIVCASEFDVCQSSIDTSCDSTCSVYCKVQGLTSQFGPGYTGYECNVAYIAPLNSVRRTIKFESTSVGPLAIGDDTVPVIWQARTSTSPDSQEVDFTNQESELLVDVLAPEPEPVTGVSGTDIIIIIVVAAILGYALVNAAIIGYHARFFQRDLPPTEDDFEGADVEEFD